MITSEEYDKEQTRKMIARIKELERELADFKIEMAACAGKYDAKYVLSEIKYKQTVIETHRAALNRYGVPV